MFSWNKKKEKIGMEEQKTKVGPARIEPIDKDGNSLIDGKTIKSVIAANMMYRSDEVVAVVFTDGTYMLSGTEVRGRSISAPDWGIVDPVDRGFLGSLIWSRTINNASKETIEKENTLFKKLIDAGLYSQDDIDGMIEDGKDTVKRQLNEQIASSIKSLLDTETRLSRIK